MNREESEQHVPKGFIELQKQLVGQWIYNKQ